MPFPQARIAAAPLIAALALASCGGGGATDETSTTPVTQQNLTGGLSGPKEQAAATIEAYIEAFNSGDPDRICPLTSRSDAALERCKSTLPAFDPPRPAPPYKLSRIEINGRRADATIVQRSGGGKSVFFQLQRVGCEWKVVVATLQG
jgi:hypothetical protein